MTAFRRRILLVEDEYLITMLLEDMLAELGCEPAATAVRLHEAVELARGGTFDLALLDLQLSGDVSYPVADALIERAIPFAFMTGRHAADLDPAYSAAPVLHKPFRRADLAEMIARLAPHEGAA
jgi:CheY-like chemotaxis protein